MEILERAFARMGARIKFGGIAPTRRWGRQQLVEDFSLDVQRDRRGEYFLVSRAPESGTEFLVLDVQPPARHLLLMTRKDREKHRFLFGHDERHWFVAGIPETARVSRVRDAIQALKPKSVLNREQSIRAN